MQVEEGALQLAMAVPTPEPEGSDRVSGQSPFQGGLPAPSLESCRKAHWLVIPGVFVLPETGAGVALKARVRNPAQTPGVLDATMITTWKRQADLDMWWLRDSIGDGWRARQRVELGRFPSIYYGLGNPPADSMKTRYEPTYLIAESRLGRYFLDGWVIEGSVGLDLESMDHRDEGAFLADDVIASDGGAYWIGGAAIEYEGRDLPENPTWGPFLRIQNRTALPGSRNLWTQVQNDVSYAATLWRFTGVGRVRTSSIWGNASFWEVPALGFRDALRGLPNRRLRGEGVQCIGTELRFNVPPILSSNWQIAGFFEQGRAGSHFGVWTSELLAAGGGGLRLLLDGGRAILRADFATSPEGHGTYLDFGQAF